MTELLATALVAVVIGGPLFLLLLDWLAGRIDEREARREMAKRRPPG